MTKFKFISLFSGCGGAAIGASLGGFDVVWGIDIDGAVCDLYRENIDSPILNMDISDVGESYLKDIDANSGDILVLQISPPCQDYSQANRTKNSQSDRASLIDKTINIIEFLKPSYIVIENVKAFGKSVAYKRWLDSMLCDYIESSVVLNSFDFGVPQSRSRFFSILTKKGLPFVDINDVEKTSTKTGWYDAIADLIPSLGKCELSKTQSNIEFTEFPVIIERVGFYDNKPKIRNKDNPIWTLRASLADDGKRGSRANIINIVTETCVYKLDTWCLARLQGFPDDYIWSDCFKQNVRGIGNSVSPPVMKSICDLIRKTNY